VLREGRRLKENNATVRKGKTPHAAKGTEAKRSNKTQKTSRPHQYKSHEASFAQKTKGKSRTAGNAKQEL